MLAEHMADLKSVRDLSKSTSCQTQLAGQVDPYPDVSYSTSKIHGIGCCCTNSDIIKYPRFIVTDCDEHKQAFVQDTVPRDIGVQVTATNIQPTIHVQTTPSLLLRTLELPKRNPYHIQNKVARKCLDSCDCEEKHLVIGGDSHDVSTQVELWLITSPEHTQIGPSLTAVGPFCRYDYHLMKTKPTRDDPYFDCWAREPGDKIICSRHREACSDFQQQVSALDISTSEHIFTESLGDLRGRVIHATSHSNIPGVFYKNLGLLECECPLSRNGRQIHRDHSFVMQATQYDICPTKIIQTDVCLLPHSCIKSRLFQSSDLNCEYEIPCESLSQKRLTTFSDFTQQVTANDIGSSEETQTCEFLSTMKPFRAFQSNDHSEYKKNVEQSMLTHRTRTISTDNCDCWDLPADIFTVDISTQVSHTDISTRTEMQTCDPVPKITKYYIRSEQWGFQTFS